MKRAEVSRSAVLFFLFSIILVIAGAVTAHGAFRSYETELYQHADLHAAAVKLMIGGGLIVAGLGMLIVLLLHLVRRTAVLQKEARALRQKHDAMASLNQQTQKLAHHQRLETIGMLTSSIAHEFNNLLTPIMGYSMMALEKLPPEEEELYDDILEIYTASLKAKEIISRLSDLSRKNTSMTFRQVSPDDLIQKTLNVVTPAKPPKVQVKVDLNCWDQRLQANEIQLSQLLLNLVLNAFHAMGEEPGTLTIRTSFDENSIQIQVADTGCGIPEDVLPRIFEPFFTTKEAGKGTGLGLAIVEQVVEDHHGEIRVDSQVGQGTSITVSLPRSFEPEALQ